MDAELKARWIAALRSGDYAQGKGKLGRREFGAHEYCCLGVLCDLERERLAAADVHTWWSSGGVFHVDYGSNFLSDLVSRTLGLLPDFWKLHFGLFTRDGGTFDLATFNDNDFTFDQIADIIEWAF